MHNAKSSVLSKIALAGGEVEVNQLGGEMEVNKARSSCIEGDKVIALDWQ